MKLRFIYVLLFSVFAMVILQSRASGAAASALGDKTGSPIGGAAGCSCHTGGFYTPSIAVSVKNAALSTVTEYMPGETYTLEFTVSAGTGNPGGYGFQALAISPATNFQAGTMNSAITSNTQISPLGGRSYAEHQFFSATGVFQIYWTAPVAGFGAVNLYSRGIAVNGSGSTAGDQQTASNLFVLNEATGTANEVISFEPASYYKLYPNPNQGAFFIENNGITGEISISILDVFGHIVHQEEWFMYGGEQRAVKVQDLSSGTYFVQLRKVEDMHILKFNIN
jgi:hypothetical protein